MKTDKKKIDIAKKKTKILVLIRVLTRNVIKGKGVDRWGRPVRKYKGQYYYYPQ